MLTSFRQLYWGGTATGSPSWRGTDEPEEGEEEQDEDGVLIQSGAKLWRLTWCSWRQRGGGPGGAVAAACRDLVDVFPLKHRHRCWFPDVVGVTQPELDDIP